jgi:hypothetical protein
MYTAGWGVSGVPLMQHPAAPSTHALPMMITFHANADLEVIPAEENNFSTSR